jgi:hypothetical protein
MVPIFFFDFIMGQKLKWRQEQKNFKNAREATIRLFEDLFHGTIPFSYLISKFKKKFR